MSVLFIAMLLIRLPVVQIAYRLISAKHDTRKQSKVNCFGKKIRHGFLPEENLGKNSRTVVK
jgi:hypothetical protein